MASHDVLYRLYAEFDTGALRDRQRFVDLFPPIDSPVALAHWQDVQEELTDRKEEIRRAFEAGEALAELAAVATRDEAFTALDLAGKYGRPVNVLVLDVDETLRSAGGTDNEIPRETLHLLTELAEGGMPIAVCTGQTLENVKGFLVQGLGSELVNAGSLSIVYEGGTGVFTPERGPRTKQLLYEGLDDEVRDVFYELRARVLRDAPDAIAQGCHLQGNEFNVTLKPNFETGSQEAVAVVDEALVYLLDLLGAVVAGRTDEVDEPSAPGDLGEHDDLDLRAAVRRFYAERDPEIRAVLEAADALPGLEPGEDGAPNPLESTLERIDVGYYEGDAAEVTSLELNKVAGVEAALDVLGVDDPFALVVGDSKSDLRVMEWAAEHDAGIAAAPEHASTAVLDHVIRTDELIFDRGDAAAILRVVYALERLDALGRTEGA